MTIHQCPHGNYAAGCPTCISEYDSADAEVIHLHQFTYWLNKKTGVVTQLLSKPKGAYVHLHEQHPMLLKVYAAYCRQHDVVGVPFNGHHYIKMFSRYFNTSNGNEVKDANIIQLVNSRG